MSTCWSPMLLLPYPLQLLFHLSHSRWQRGGQRKRRSEPPGRQALSSQYNLWHSRLLVQFRKQHHAFRHFVSSNNSSRRLIDSILPHMVGFPQRFSAPNGLPDILTSYAHKKTFNFQISFQISAWCMSYWTSGFQLFRCGALNQHCKYHRLTTFPGVELYKYEYISKRRCHSSLSGDTQWHVPELLLQALDHYNNFSHLDNFFII